MSKIKSAVQAFMVDENGVTAIEYGLIAGLVGAAMVAAAIVLGDKLLATYAYVKDQFKSLWA